MALHNPKEGHNGVNKDELFLMLEVSIDDGWINDKAKFIEEHEDFSEYCLSSKWNIAKGIEIIQTENDKDLYDDKKDKTKDAEDDAWKWGICG